LNLLDSFASQAANPSWSSNRSSMNFGIDIHDVEKP
jgi:hypothetical protein